ncbi:UBP-type zinc finger domain-containing protein [Sporobolomyces koalae]|uniref:UBP-type zinc finger domain-containing protein n=1 Tax=Sporobolomyces koalae TaxID=500713 RepID=UPI00316CF214
MAHTATTTTTATTLMQAPSATSITSLHQSPGALGSSCRHFKDWFKSHQTLERVTLLSSRISGLATGSTESASNPTCSVCSQASLRPFVCLSCGVTHCGSLRHPSHAQEHSRKDGHALVWDLRSQNMYCLPCKIYPSASSPAASIESQSLDRIRLNERLKTTDHSKPLETSISAGSAGAARKKRRRRHEGENASFESAALSTLVVPARGIRNLGNSCYMSVILQSFFLNPFLRAYFLSDRHNRTQCSRSTQNEACLSCELDGLFSDYFSAGPNEALAPTRFLHAFWSSSFEALGYAQQDAHEFLISTLNLLHSHSPQMTDNPNAKCPCIVHNTFSGRTRSQIKCGRCGHESETFEMFLDLSLDVRDRSAGKDLTRLQDCLRSFTGAEKLPSKYDCQACGNPPEPASKRLSITTLPQILCIQLKRFEHTSLTSGGTKIDSFVQYPLELDMTPYLSSALDYPALLTNNKLPKDEYRYNLLSVVAHEGSLSQGHYTTYVRGTDDFFHIDDEKVRRAGLKEVLGSKAYLLVYSRI